MEAIPSASPCCGKPMRLSSKSHRLDSSKAPDRTCPTVSAKLDAGDELILLPRIGGMFSGGDITLRDLTVAEGAGGSIAYRIPRSWEGVKKGSSDANPAVADGKPLWRLDQVWPDDPIIADHYTPLTWNGTAWSPEKNGLGGQPEAKIEAGAVDLAVRGPWTGNSGPAHCRSRIRRAAIGGISPRRAGSRQPLGRRGQSLSPRRLQEGHAAGGARKSSSSFRAMDRRCRSSFRWSFRQVMNWRWSRSCPTGTTPHTLLSKTFRCVSWPNRALAEPIAEFRVIGIPAVVLVARMV